MEEHIRKYKAQFSNYQDVETPLLEKYIRKENPSINANANINVDNPVVQSENKIYNENEFLRNQQQQQQFDSHSNSSSLGIFSSRAFLTVSIITALLYVLIIYLILTYG